MLLQLPLEIIYVIISDIKSINNIRSLFLTCKQLKDILRISVVEIVTTEFLPLSWANQFTNIKRLNCVVCESVKEIQELSKKIERINALCISEKNCKFKDICKEITRKSIEGSVVIIDLKYVETVLYISKQQWYGLKTCKNSFSKKDADKLLENTDINLEILDPYSDEYESLINLNEWIRSPPNPLFEITIKEITIKCDFTVRKVDSLFARILNISPGFHQTRNLDLALARICCKYRDSEGKYELPLILCTNLSKFGIHITDKIVRIYYPKIIPDIQIKDLKSFVKEEDVIFGKIWSPSYLETYKDILEARSRPG